MRATNTKLIFKLLLSLAVLAVTGVLVYNNFIKEKKKFFYAPAADTENQALFNKFNFDFFDNEVFKNLVKSKQISTSTIKDKVGRENPFLKPLNQ